ncbi:MAG: AraC family transcriptional regulator, partial [Bacteroidota bacterium]
MLSCYLLFRLIINNQISPANVGLRAKTLDTQNGIKPTQNGIMKTRIYGADLNEMLVEADYPEWFKDESAAILERSFSAEIFLGKGGYKEVFFEGVHIGYGDLQIFNNTILNFESEFETVEMHFALNGETVTESNYFNHTIKFLPGSHNVFYTNGFQGLSEWSSRTPLRIFEINMTPSFVKKYLPDNHILFDVFRKSMLDKESAILSNQNYPITIEMYGIINEIIQCERTGVFKRLFLESKVISLLLLQLEQISSFNRQNSRPSLKKQDIEKMYAVKDLLDINFRKTDTLTDLAKKVGTNEYTLKKGFKELFGTSVFQYWKGLRLETAKNMLLNDGLSVQEVSLKIGYKNPQHFTTAFKKQF